MFLPLSTLLFIFVTYLKEKMKENDFFFGKNLGTPRVRMQKYPKSISIQKVSGTDTAPFLEYPYFKDVRIKDTEQDRKVSYAGDILGESGLILFTCG